MNAADDYADTGNADSGILLSRVEENNILGDGKSFKIAKPELEAIFKPIPGGSDAVNRFKSAQAGSINPESPAYELLNFLSDALIAGFKARGYENNLLLMEKIYEQIHFNPSNGGNLTIALASKKYTGSNHARRVEFEDGSNAILINEDYYNALRKALEIVRNDKENDSDISSAKETALYYLAFEKIMHELCKNISALVPLYKAGDSARFAKNVQRIETASFLYTDALLYSNLVYNQPLHVFIEEIFSDPDLQELKTILSAKERFRALHECCREFGPIRIEDIDIGWIRKAKEFAAGMGASFLTERVYETAQTATGL